MFVVCEGPSTLQLTGKSEEAIFAIVLMTADTVEREGYGRILTTPLPTPPKKKKKSNSLDRKPPKRTLEKENS